MLSPEEQELFREVSLYVHECKEEKLVTVVKIPRFKPMPEAIMWGIRVFFKQMNKDETKFCYIEGLLYVVPPEPKTVIPEGDETGRS